MTTNATVEARHETEALRIWRELTETEGADIIAQALANLEAARAENADLTNRLAEIARLLATYQAMFRAKRQLIEDAHALASGHTPSPCPSCAAKDEAMEAFKADVSEAMVELDERLKEAGLSSSSKSRIIASRFIIPPADTVAEALKAAWTKLWPEDTGIPTACQALRDELAKHGLELSRLGGAK